MDLIFERTDFDKVRLSIYEKCNDGSITEEEKNSLMEAVTIREMNECLIEEAALGDTAAMMKVAAIAAGAVAAAAGITILVMKVISMLKVKDKIKASTELTNINNDIKKCNAALKKTRDQLSAIINQYRTDVFDADQRSDFYGSRILSNPVTTHNTDGTTSYGVQQSYNPQYDKEKAAEEKKKAEKIRKTVNEYIKKRDELKTHIKELKALKSKFMSVVRNNTTAEECAGIKAELDKIMANIPETE